MVLRHHNPRKVDTMDARKIPALATAAMALLASTAALAAGDIPSGATTEATLPIQVLPSGGDRGFVGDSDSYRVTLREDETHGLFLDEVGDASSFDVAVRDVTGEALRKATNGEEASAGFEFVARGSGTYFVDAKLNAFDLATDGTHRVAIGPDGLVGAATTCAPEPGKTQRRDSAFDDDKDRFRVGMRAGEACTPVADDVDDQITTLTPGVVDAAGEVLATSVRDDTKGKNTVPGSWPPKAGTYHARVCDLFDEASGSCTIVAS